MAGDVSQELSAPGFNLCYQKTKSKMKQVHGKMQKPLREKVNESLSFLPPIFLGLLFPSNTNVAVVHPDAMSIVFAVAFHCVVGEVTLCYFKIWVDDHLWVKKAT